MPLPNSARDRIAPRIRRLAAWAYPFPEPFAPEVSSAAQTGAFRRDIAPCSLGSRKCFNTIGHNRVSSRFLRRASSLSARMIVLSTLWSPSLDAANLLSKNRALSMALISARGD